MPSQIECVVLSFLPQAMEEPHVSHQVFRQHQVIRGLGGQSVENVLNVGNAAAEAPI
ncbi:hypothetical protein ATK74_1401 [Propionicimonas paludicola]|uniref:Uncharacterized protein n=1 Tax=Propionicimonas paludicola TaxID=185243 RepID=A0A2A9CRU2_9ACTN|nr:hypothetical protein ATK74_1401 [Propionicimonas paludicola]